jgi:hypothetical protein
MYEYGINIADTPFYMAAIIISIFGAAVILKSIYIDVFNKKEYWFSWSIKVNLILKWLAFSFIFIAGLMYIGLWSNQAIVLGLPDYLIVGSVGNIAALIGCFTIRNWLLLPSATEKEKFEIKHNIWLISVVFIALAKYLNFWIGNIFLDVIILTLLVFTFSYFYNKKKWQWYEFINMFTYIFVLYFILYYILRFPPVSTSLLYLSF